MFITYLYYKIISLLSKLVPKFIKNCGACRSRKQWAYRWKAKWDLINRYEYLNEVNKILESYITKRILDGGSQDFLAKSRSDLVNKTNEIKETEKMVEFFRNIK